MTLIYLFLSIKKRNLPFKAVESLKRYFTLLCKSGLFVDIVYSELYDHFYQEFNVENLLLRDLFLWLITLCHTKLPKTFNPYKSFSSNQGINLFCNYQNQFLCACKRWHSKRFKLQFLACYAIISAMSAIQLREFLWRPNSNFFILHLFFLLY